MMTVKLEDCLVMCDFACIPELQFGGSGCICRYESRVPHRCISHILNAQNVNVGNKLHGWLSSAGGTLSNNTVRVPVLKILTITIDKYATLFSCQQWCAAAAFPKRS